MAARVQVVTTGYDGAPGYNTFYTSNVEPSEIIEWVATVDLLWDGLESVLANGTIWTRSGTIEIFNPANGQTTGVLTGSPVSGSGTWGTAKAPAGTALLLQWRTGTYANGREIRGRSFISGIGDFGDTAGAVPNSILTDAGSAANAYVGGGELASVYSPTNGLVEEITGTGVWNKFGLIRSRRD